MPVYTVGIVGESHDNSDGSSRQLEIDQCKPGELVLIYPEPGNQYDRNALKVMSKRGVQIGYIGRDNNEWIGERLRKEAKLTSFIYRIAGGTFTKPHLGVVLALGVNVESMDEYRELFDQEEDYLEWLECIIKAVDD